MKLRPSIIHTGQRAQILFQLTLHPEHTHKEIADFVESAWEKYYTDFSRCPAVSRAVRAVDANVLAGIILNAADYANPDAPTSMINVLTIRTDISAVNRPEFIPIEHLECQLHRHDAETGQEYVTILHPVGFQTMGHQQPGPSNFKVMVSYDMRVQNSDVEASRDFYIDTAIPKLDGYIDELKQIFARGSNNDFNVDTKAAVATLCNAINEHREERLLDPANNLRCRFTFEIEYFFGGSKDDTMIGFAITRDTEETSTPNLPITNSEYKSVAVKQKEILGTFKSVRTVPLPPVELEVKSTSKPMIIEDSAADELNKLTESLKVDPVVVAESVSTTETVTETTAVAENNEPVANVETQQSTETATENAPVETASTETTSGDAAAHHTAEASRI